MRSRIILILTLVFSASCVIHFSGCTIEDPPTPADLAVVSTDSVLNVGTDSAWVQGRIESDGGSPVISRGICWSTDSVPTIHDDHTVDTTNNVAFLHKIAGLQEGTIYYARAYAANIAGVAYGGSIRFSTNAKDLDGNIYHTVIIGTQLWMVENLQTTHYRNGDPIQKITDPRAWETASGKVGTYCTYDYNEANAPVYGRLYSYWVLTDMRNVCPEGWRLPTDEDWQTLQNHLGGYQVAGGALKEAGTEHWQAPNTGATNSSGFTARPAGNCGYGGFASLGSSCYFWSDPAERFTVALLKDHEDVAGTGNGASILGLSIRCIRQ